MRRHVSLGLAALVLATAIPARGQQQQQQQKPSQKPPQETATAKMTALFALYKQMRQQSDEMDRLFLADRIDQAMDAAERTEELQRGLLARVERDLPDNRELPPTFRSQLSATLRFRADRFEERDDLDAALRLRREAVALEEALRPAGDWQLADARRALKRVETLRALDPEARTELAEARTLNRRVLRLTEQGQWAEALPLATRAVAIRKRLLGAKDIDYAASLSNLAGLLESLGDDTGAEPLYRQAVTITRDAVGERHPRYSQSLNNLAYLHFKMGDDAEAERLFRESLRLVREVLDERHPEYAARLGNLGALRHAHGDDEQAEALLTQALAITRAIFGDRSADTATLLNNLAAVAEARGNRDRAETLYRQSLSIREQLLGPDHPACALSLNNLAELWYSSGDYARAEADFQRALAIQKKAVGEAHPEYARALHNLAGVYHAQGDLARAEPLYRQALEVRTRTLGASHMQTGRSLDALALLEASQGRWHEAAETEDRARRIFRRYTARVLPALSEREQLTFLLTTDSGALGSALSLGLAQRDDPQVARLSAGWVVNGKALAQQALAERTLLGREGRDPALSSVVRRLQEVRARLAGATLAGQAPDRLAEEEQDLASTLGQARGRPGRGDEWVELDAVRNALEPGSVLVEIARVLVYDFHAEGKPSPWTDPRYAAWIIPAAGAGAVRAVDLGPAEPIDAAVAVFRKALRAAPQAIYERGEAAAETELKATLEALAARVLRPLETELAGASRWVISPDAALWLVPWGALTLKDGRYALEEHAIRYVVSGRNLVGPPVALARGPAPPSSGLMLADPDYDLAARPRPQGSGERGTGRLAASPLLTNWPRLPGTAEEAEAIRPGVERYLGAAPVVVTGEGAVEGVVKAIRRPRALVLSTHGFFLPDPPIDRKTLPALVDRPDSARRWLENPLLRCGLVLAGANQREQMTDPNGDDGVLTGLEIVGTDLHGTDLVVLSACETGLGQLRNGEGVSGLRQSFQLAGARAVVATLWPIADEETVALMTPFWNALAAGRDESDALRDAQFAVIRNRRASDQAAHPYFWAAFTLTGPPHP